MEGLFGAQQWVWSGIQLAVSFVYICRSTTLDHKPSCGFTSGEVQKLRTSTAVADPMGGIDPVEEAPFRFEERRGFWVSLVEWEEAV